MSPQCQAFFDGLYAIAPKNVDLMMDHALNNIDDWCWASEWALIDEVLSHVDPKRIDPSLSWGLIVNTWDSMPLPSRPALVKRVHEHFLQIMDKDRVEKLMEKIK